MRRTQVTASECFWNLSDAAYHKDALIVDVFALLLTLLDIDGCLVSTDALDQLPPSSPRRLLSGAVRWSDDPYNHGNHGSAPTPTKAHVHSHNRHQNSAATANHRLLRTSQPVVQTRVVSSRAKARDVVSPRAKARDEGRQLSVSRKIKGRWSRLLFLFPSCFANRRPSFKSFFCPLSLYFSRLRRVCAPFFDIFFFL